MIEVKQKIIAIVAEYTDVDKSEFESANNFDELGIDSLSLVEIVFEIEESFDIKIPQDDELLNKNISLSNFNDIVKLVIQLIAQNKESA